MYSMWGIGTCRTSELHPYHIRLQTYIFNSPPLPEGSVQAFLSDKVLEKTIFVYNDGREHYACLGTSLSMHSHVNRTEQIHVYNKVWCLKGVGVIQIKRCLVLLTQFWFQMVVNLSVLYIEIKLVVGEKIIKEDKNCLNSNVENTFVAGDIGHRPH